MVKQQSGTNLALPRGARSASAHPQVTLGLTCSQCPEALLSPQVGILQCHGRWAGAAVTCWSPRGQ